MPNLIGHVSYQDDGAIFRRVELLPDEPDELLNDPKWITEGCDPGRVAVMSIMTRGEYVKALHGVADASTKLNEADAVIAQLDAAALADPATADLSAEAAAVTDYSKKQEMFDRLARAVLFTGMP